MQTVHVPCPYDALKSAPAPPEVWFERAPLRDNDDTDVDDDERTRRRNRRGKPSLTRRTRSRRVDGGRRIRKRAVDDMTRVDATTNGRSRSRVDLLRQLTASWLLQ